MIGGGLRPPLMVSMVSLILALEGSSKSLKRFYVINPFDIGNWHTATKGNAGVPAISNSDSNCLIFKCIASSPQGQDSQT